MFRAEFLDKSLQARLGLARLSLRQQRSDPFQRFPEAFLFARFQQVIQSMDVECLESVLIVRGDENDDGHTVLGYSLENVKTPDFRHLDIEEHQVRGGLFDNPESLPPGTAFIN